MAALALVVVMVADEKNRVYIFRIELVLVQCDIVDVPRMVWLTCCVSALSLGALALVVRQTLTVRGTLQAVFLAGARVYKVP